MSIKSARKVWEKARPLDAFDEGVKAWDDFGWGAKNPYHKDQIEMMAWDEAWEACAGTWWKKHRDTIKKHEPSWYVLNSKYIPP